MKIILRTTLLFFLLLVFIPATAQEHSIAREWNEILLNAIRTDFARPTVHSRNLFHTSIAMYDAWAAYDTTAKPYFLGNSLGNYNCPFVGVNAPQDTQAARQMAISYAMANVLKHRFKNSPNAAQILLDISLFMNTLGYDENYTNTDYTNGNPADLGNYIAKNIIAAGLIDGANETNGYANQYYTPVNDDLYLEGGGNNSMIDPNHWQPIFLTNFIDQSGNPIGQTPAFLSPEWGNVVPFSLSEENKTTYYRDGNTYPVYHDPGTPDLIDTTQSIGIESAYKWGFSMVAAWSSHLDPSDSVMWDISPAGMGNVQELPETSADFPNFYDFNNGGDNGMGHPINPHTNMPYQAQIVPRGDYARVLAEFWADGPQSETPPGHWFTIFNTVSDHPLCTKKWNGKGETLNNLEWDVKSYLTLGGAMHDCAISAWSIKGWYDYLRPVSAIRYMAELGQSSDENLPNFHPGGIPLIPNFIEIVTNNDPLAMNPENIGKVKIYTWKGPDYIDMPATDMAGVGWIMANEWWPYQRPSFVTPPFAGYVSGHSTFSRAAAEVMTLITGDAYFPGGMGEFEAPKNEFLVFEQGPSVDIKLQWATYRDASDQCSLSRIWGGIHPPCDDIPGRRIGLKIGPDAYKHALQFFDAKAPLIVQNTVSDNQISDDDEGENIFMLFNFNEAMNTNIIPSVSLQNANANSILQWVNTQWLNDVTLQVTYVVNDNNQDLGSVGVEIDNAIDINGNEIENYIWQNALNIDTQNPISTINANYTQLSDVEVGSQVAISIVFSEEMNTQSTPNLHFTNNNPTLQSLILENSAWLNDSTFVTYYTLNDANETLNDIVLEVNGANDAMGNTQTTALATPFSIDTQNPNMTVSINKTLVNDAEVGNLLIVNFIYSENMNPNIAPDFIFNNDNPLLNSLSLKSASWFIENRYVMTFDIKDANENLENISLQVINAKDLAGNLQVPSVNNNLITIDTQNPSATISINHPAVADNITQETFTISVNFEEKMDSVSTPILQFLNENPTQNTLSLKSENWENENLYTFNFEVLDNNESLENIELLVSNAKDLAGNEQNPQNIQNAFVVDTKNPNIAYLETNLQNIENQEIGEQTFSIIAIFDETMNTDVAPEISFPNAPLIEEVLTLDTLNSSWINQVTYIAKYHVNAHYFDQNNIDIVSINAQDIWLNTQNTFEAQSVFSIQINPSTSSNNLVQKTHAKVYPNPLPSAAPLQIELLENCQKLHIQLINIAGQTLHTQTLTDVLNTSIELPTPQLASGIYFLFLENENWKQVVKVVVE